MDLSPKPPRRFSRWQTTKRPFALGGATFKQPNNIPDLQDDHNRSKASKEKARKVNDRKNDKIQQNYLNDSTTDSVPKQTSQRLSSGKRSAVARQLYLNTSKRAQDKHEATITAEIIQPAQERLNGGPSLHQNASADKRGIRLTTDSSLSNKLPKQHGREDDEVISNETTHQNSKNALSSISQNASAIKPATIPSLLSQSKIHNSLNNASHSAIETDVLACEATKHHRQAIEDEELSSTSSTDKENKDKEPTNLGVALSVVKKQKQDGALHSLSISKSNSVLIEHINLTHADTTLNKQNVSGEDLGIRMSTLRNRSLLASPETLSKKRQYPAFHSSHKKSEQRKDLLMEKNNSCSSAESSFNEKIDNQKVSPVSEIKSKQQNMKNSHKKSSADKHRSKDKGNSANNSGLEFKKQNKSLHINKSRNIFEIAATKSFTEKEKPDNYSDSNDTSSSSLRGGLRDRRSLPTPEQVQQKRQYPISYLSSKKSTDNVNFNTSRKVVDKKRHNVKSVSTLDSTKSSVSKNKTSSKYETHDSSNHKIGRRNNSAMPEILTINNHESSKKHLQLTRKSDTLQHNMHVAQTDTEVADVSNTSKKLQTGSNVKYTDKKNKQTSLKHHLKSYSPELEDKDFTARPSKKSSHSKHSFSSTAERCAESSATADVSVQLLQLPATVTDTSCKRAQKRPPSRLKPTTEDNHVQTVSTRLATVTSPKVSVSDVVLVSQKQLKNGKLDAPTTQPKILLTRLSTDRRDVVFNSISQKNKQVSSEMKKKTTVNPLAESKMKDTNASMSHSKLPLLKAKRKRLSLPRRPLTKLSDDEHSFNSSFEEDDTPIAAVDVSAQSPQRSETSDDTSHEKPQNAAHKRPSPQRKINNKKSKVQFLSTKLATSTSLDEQINESALVSRKHPRKRRLLEEIDRAEEDAEADNQVLLWCPGGRRSDVTAYDVILQAMVDEEDKMLDVTKDDSIEYRTVKKVMSRLRHNIKPMIKKVRRIKNLKLDIRQQKSRIKKLMEDIKEQQRTAQFNRENHRQQDSDQDVLLARYKDTMKRYSQLINRFVQNS